jgi:hypothetical protein
MMMMMVMMINSEMWSTSGGEEKNLLVLFNHVRVRGSSAAGLAGEEMASKGSAADPSPISLCLHTINLEKKMRAFGSGIGGIGIARRRHRRRRVRGAEEWRRRNQPV